MSAERLRELLLARLSIGGFDACWEWKGTRTPDGYGRLYALDGKYRVHRLTYSLWRGDIPPGLQIDHLCRNRLCANPRHMEVVTNRTNVLRGIGPSALNARKTHCPQGHEYTPENTRVSKKNKRHCRVCHRLLERKRRAARVSL